MSLTTLALTALLLNHHASALFGRPNTHGPLLMTKTIFLKIGIEVHDVKEQEGVISHLIGLWQLN